MDLRLQARRHKPGAPKGGSSKPWTTEEDETLRLIFKALIEDLAPRSPGGIIKRLELLNESQRDIGRKFPYDQLG